MFYLNLSYLFHSLEFTEHDTLAMSLRDGLVYKYFAWYLHGLIDSTSWQENLGGGEPIK